MRLLITIAIELTIACSIFGVTDYSMTPNLLPRWLLSLICLSVLSILISIAFIRRKRTTKPCLTTIVAFIVWQCFNEAVFGILHFLLGGYHEGLIESGTFDNPAGFSSCLCAALPFCFTFLEGKAHPNYIVPILIGIISVTLIFSGSRAGLLSSVVASAYMLKNSFMGRMSKHIFNRTIIVTLLIVSAMCLVGLYLFKSDSADGRIMIWLCAVAMILDAPIIGHGYGAIERDYMDYQAQYLSSHPNGRWQMLADNVHHVFNEYLAVGVQFGIVGLLILAVLCIFVINCSKRCSTKMCRSALASLFSLATFSLFSYPYYYPFAWIISFIDLYIIIAAAYPNILKQLLSKYNKVIGIMMLLMAFVLGAYCAHRSYAEVYWTRTAKNYTLDERKKLMNYEKLSSLLGADAFFLFHYSLELYLNGNYTQSLMIAERCNKKWADYDLEILIAANYSELHYFKLAEQHQIKAMNMCPNKLEPLYHRFLDYAAQNRRREAEMLGREILLKPPKVKSYEAAKIKADVRQYLSSHSLK